MAWGVGLGLLLGWDGWLVSHGHRSLSLHARAHPYVTGAGLCYLGAHLYGQPAVLRRLDPLAACARRISRAAPG